MRSASPSLHSLLPDKLQAIRCGSTRVFCRTSHSHLYLSEWSPACPLTWAATLVQSFLLHSSPKEEAHRGTPSPPLSSLLPLPRTVFTSESTFTRQLLTIKQRMHMLFSLRVLTFKIFNKMSCGCGRRDRQHASRYYSNQLKCNVTVLNRLFWKTFVPTASYSTLNLFLKLTFTGWEELQTRKYMEEWILHCLSPLNVNIVNSGNKIKQK